MTGTPGARARLIDIWQGWEDAYRDPIGGWAGIEQFREWFEHDRDAMADRVRTGTPEATADDARALRAWITVGAELRVAVRGVDNIAEARRRLLADLDELLEDLAKGSSANSGKPPRKNCDLRSSRGSNGGGLVQRIPTMPATTRQKLLAELSPSDRRRVAAALADADRQIAHDRRAVRQAKTFAERVRDLRGDRTQGEFGRMLGVRDKDVSGWENAHKTLARRGMPKFAVRQDIAERCGKSPGYLITEALDDDQLAELTPDDEDLLP